MKYLAALSIIAILLIAGCTQLYNGEEGTEEARLEQTCEDTGGSVTTRLCCESVTLFPNTCLIGACGCPPEGSHEVKVCDCGEGRCWNGTSCV